MEELKLIARGCGPEGEETEEYYMMADARALLKELE